MRTVLVPRSIDALNRGRGKSILWWTYTWRRGGGWQIGFRGGHCAGTDGFFPDRLEDGIGEDHVVRVINLLVVELDLLTL